MTSGLARFTASSGRALSALPDALTIAYRMVSTKDASVIVFHRAEDADDYTGCGDDSATQFGRMIVSYGSPYRVVPARQGEYDRAVRTFRREHPGVRNDVDRVVRFLTRRGLPMRDPQIEDSQECRRQRLPVRTRRPVLRCGSSRRTARSTSGSFAASWAERARQGSNLRPTA